MDDNKNKLTNTDDYIEKIKNYVKDVKYGSLTLIIQDGRVIQIDKMEKIRL